MGNWEKFWDKEATANAFYIIQSAKPDWEESEFFADGEKWVSEIIVSPHYSQTNTSKVLDFGCGVGRLTFALGHICEHVVGTDISQVMIDKANLYKEKFSIHKNVDFVKSSGEDLSGFKDGEFTFVFSSIVLQHIENPLRWKMREELIRVLKPGEWLYFQDESFEVEREHYKRWLEERCSFVEMKPQGKESVIVWAKKK